MPRTSRLAVGGPAGETTDFGADHKFSPLERMLLYSCCLYRDASTPHRQSAPAGGGPDPPSSRALLLGGGSAMSLVVQGGYRAVCGRSNTRMVHSKPLQLGPSHVTSTEPYVTARHSGV